VESPVSLRFAIPIEVSSDCFTDQSYAMSVDQNLVIYLSQGHRMPNERWVDPRIKFPLYKFTRGAYAESFFSNGTLRLGTLYDYRREETYKAGIPDIGEGLATFVTSSVDEQGTVVPTFAHTHAINNWIYCCTEVFRPEFFEVFDADCCYEINNIEFFNAIDRVMETECTSYLLRCIRYVDNRHNVPGNDFAGVVKEVSFAHQMEVRACWQQKARPEYPVGTIPEGGSNFDPAVMQRSADYVEKEHKRMQPIIIRVPRATSYCSRKLVLKAQPKAAGMEKGTEIIYRISHRVPRSRRPQIYCKATDPVPLKASSVSFYQG
jgi:hypothetical protein